MQPWTAGFERGASVLTVADASGFSVGDQVFLESANEQDPMENTDAYATPPLPTRAPS